MRERENEERGVCLNTVAVKMRGSKGRKAGDNGGGGAPSPLIPSLGQLPHRGGITLGCPTQVKLAASV